MRLAEAKAVTGGLSSPSKMPGYGYGLPARACITGSKLAEIDGSVCSRCYAMGGNYRWPGVVACQEKRLQASLEHPQWIEAMVVLIDHYCKREPWFRWFDSGDLQSIEHLERVVKVAEATPTVKHWLPTRETWLVTKYLKAHGSFPDNLTVRLSAHMLNHKPTTGAVTINGLRFPMATVSTKSNRGTLAKHGARLCPAQDQEGKCGACRACWDTDTKWVDYALH